MARVLETHHLTIIEPVLRMRREGGEKKGGGGGGGGGVTSTDPWSSDRSMNSVLNTDS